MGAIYIDNTWGLCPSNTGLPGYDIRGNSIPGTLGLLWTAKQLYPQRFADLDMVAECKVFYKEFFGLELTDEVINNILFGSGMRAARE